MEKVSIPNFNTKNVALRGFGSVFSQFEGIMFVSGLDSGIYRIYGLNPLEFPRTARSGNPGHV